MRYLPDLSSARRRILVKPSGRKCVKNTSAVLSSGILALSGIYNFFFFVRFVWCFLSLPTGQKTFLRWYILSRLTKRCKLFKSHRLTRYPQALPSTSRANFLHTIFKKPLLAERKQSSLVQEQV
jgi:hypothetical protein